MPKRESDADFYNRQVDRYRNLAIEMGKENDRLRDEDGALCRTIESLRAEVASLRAALGEKEGPGQPTCTGVSASWCPIHGDCTCPRHTEGAMEGEAIGGRLDDPSCPLHSDTCSHPTVELRTVLEAGRGNQTAPDDGLNPSIRQELEGI